jgi:hypothetical protein
MPHALPRLGLPSLVVALTVLLGSATPAAAVGLPGAPGCPVFPADNVWNEPVDTLPVAVDSTTLIDSMRSTNRTMHPDFGSFSGYGIPYNVVGSNTRRSAVKFHWPAESDKGPYPIPSKFKREGGSDHHLLMVDRNACKLYELYAAVRKSDGWHAGSGAIWDLRSNKLRPAGWTSADAAGLPILPGLVRYDEVHAGAILHALRFTADLTRKAYIYPARHQASDDTSASLPPMGLRIRLKADFNISPFGPQSRVLLTALKTYGMILADNGSSFYVTGAPNPGWNDDDLHKLNQIDGNAFEVVDTSSLRNGS